MARIRKPNWRAIKTHRNYTVEEAAGKLGVAKGTVRRWIRGGLPAIANRKPALILGAELVDFHRRQATPRHKCQPHECYCVKCRAPRSPAGGMAEYLPISPTSGNLRAICPECSTLMHRRVTLLRLPVLSRVLELSVPLAIEHLIDSPNPSLDDTFGQEPSPHA